MHSWPLTPCFPLNRHATLRFTLGRFGRIPAPYACCLREVIATSKSVLHSQPKCDGRGDLDQCAKMRIPSVVFLPEISQTSIALVSLCSFYFGCSTTLLCCSRAPSVGTFAAAQHRFSVNSCRRVSHTWHSKLKMSTQQAFTAYVAGKLNASSTSSSRTTGAD